jgi:hypothetical protein
MLANDCQSVTRSRSVIDVSVYSTRFQLFCEYGGSTLYPYPPPTLIDLINIIVQIDTIVKNRRSLHFFGDQTFIEFDVEIDI